jgi:predicted phosphodiesterase
MGNADAWLLNVERDVVEPISKEQRDVRAWTVSKLTGTDLDFLRTLQLTAEIKLDDKQRLLCFHGSPQSYDDVLLPETSKEDWNSLLGKFAPVYMAGGHTHTQQVRRVGAGLFFNPGSIGVVYDYHLPNDQFHTDPWAEYAVLSYEERRMCLSFHRVPYDLEELIELIKTSGRPHADRMVADYRRR